MHWRRRVHDVLNSTRQRTSTHRRCRTAAPAAVPGGRRCQDRRQIVRILGSALPWRCVGGKLRWAAKWRRSPASQLPTKSLECRMAQGPLDLRRDGELDRDSVAVDDRRIKIVQDVTERDHVKPLESNQRRSLSRRHQYRRIFRPRARPTLRRPPSGWVSRTKNAEPAKMGCSRRRNGQAVAEIEKHAAHQQPAIFQLLHRHLAGKGHACAVRRFFRPRSSRRNFENKEASKLLCSGSMVVPSVR